MPPTIYLLDGHALAYRAYFALTAGGTGGDRWRTSSGEPTAAVYGFTSILLRILEQERPDFLAVAFDTGRTFRDEIYPEYKATRAKMPDDLVPQMERIRQIVDAFGFPRLEVEGYEADDVLGSAARRSAAEQGMGVKIITGDRDLLQLVDNRIIVSLPKRQLSESEDYTPEKVLAVFGVRPDQIVDFKALVGDKSDNIPGVRGIGEKTAVKLLQKYGDLDNIYAHLDELSPSIRKKLEAGREAAYLSRRLAKIHTDLPVSVDLEAARPNPENAEKVEELFRVLEFRSLLRRLRQWQSALSGEEEPAQLSLFGDAVAQSTKAAHTADLGFRTVVVDTPAALNDLLKRIQNAKTLAVDTETTDTDKMRARLVGISLAVGEETGYYIPIAHRQAARQLPWEQVRAALAKPMADPKIAKIGHNIKYDLVVLARHGLPMSQPAFDTMIAEWLRDPSSHNLGLKNLVWVRLGLEMTAITDLIGRGKKQIGMDEVPVEQAAPYAAADAVMVLRLRPLLEADLRERNAWRLFREVEMPLVPVLARMEMNGIAVDVAFLRRMSAELAEQLHALEEQIFALVGRKFNLNSTAQLSKVLFETLGLKPPEGTRRTKSGHYSTSASVLEAMSGQHPVVDLVLEHRELSKIKSTYVDALPQQVNPETGRVHTSFNQTGTVTGRIASSDPNLQNIPVRSEVGKKVRRAFIAPEGKLLLSVDYSQVELRIVAHMARDKAMIEAFKEGQDIHAVTASKIYRVPLEKVTPQMRRHAKAINFGLLYGMSPFGLTRTTDLTLAEAENFVEEYFRNFPGVKEFLEETKRKAAERGYVETLLGRRRYFPELQKPANRNARLRAEREAVNAPVQGTAADIMKLAMIAVDRRLAEEGSDAKMLLQVHDELMLEVPEEELEETARLVQDTMENVYPLVVPLKTEAKAGPNWGELKPLAVKDES